MSPGSARLAGNLSNSGQGPVFYVGCVEHEWVEARRDLGRPCPRGHLPRQVKVRLRCPTCRWEDSANTWREHPPKCPAAPDGNHRLRVLQYSPI